MLSKSNIKSLTQTNLVQFYKSILIWLLACGFDFNVWKYKLCLKLCVFAYCVFLVTINVYANLTCCAGQELSIIWSVIEYTATVIVSLVLTNQIRPYFQKLTDIDTYLRIGIKYYSSTKSKMLLCTFVLWAIRFFYTLMYSIWFPNYEYLSLFLISQFSLLALDLNRVWRFILFDMTRYRLKMLRRRMEEMKNYNFYCYVSNNKTLKQSRIRFCLDLYKNLADALDTVLPELYASVSKKKIRSTWTI